MSVRCRPSTQEREEIMSLYNRTYGPINKHTTMFKTFKKGHPDYIGEDHTPFAKSFIRHDIPTSMQYPGRFDADEWYSVNKQYASQTKKQKFQKEMEEMEKRRLLNIEKSLNKTGLSRSRAIRFATPSWLTRSQREKIRQMKNIVKRLNKRDGLNTWSLDHIIPLRGRLVSGLHIPANLVIMETRPNNAKGNDF
jgi:hypothetical protein